ncbi:MAG: hypothetical protein VKO65_07390 [Cyanobacteriota bacterium]|nr:hypothetical protein [Cyanobacteriota bacterium]
MSIHLASFRSMVDHGRPDPGQPDPWRLHHSRLQSSRPAHAQLLQALPDPGVGPHPNARSAHGAPLNPVAAPACTVFAHPVFSTPPLLLPVDWVPAASGGPVTALSPAWGSRPGRESQRRGALSPLIPLLFTATLLLAATLVAPERPADQEAICQRHNGAAACRVW